VNAYFPDVIHLGRTVSPLTAGPRLGPWAGRRGLRALPDFARVKFVAVAMAKVFDPFRNDFFMERNYLSP
jgi:hypothetical protein